MSHPNSEYKAFSFDIQSSSLTTTEGNLQHCNGSSVPVFPILHTAPPVLRSQNTPEQKWKADHDTLKEYNESDWFKNQDIEPLMPNNGRSIFVRWLDGVGEGQSWTCRVPLNVEGSWCDHKPFGRPDRAIAHVRKHLDLKPFPCAGRCGNEEWYVPELS